VAPAEAVVAVAVVEAPVAVAVAQAPAAVGPSEAERRAMERAAELERKLVASEAERRRLADGMHFFAEERSRIEAERRRLAAASAASDKRPNPAMLAQQEAVAQLIARAKTAIERASRHVSRLGINPDKLVAGGPKAAVGGPFVEYGRVARGQPIHAGLVTLGDRIGRLTDLRQAMTAVPAGAPLGTYEVSSAFGVRRDPFNGRTAMHSGVDLATPAGNDVKTRAPGKVVFAGWGGVYGNVVEIDHGYGLRTRYGHLSRFTVRVGEAVKAHATIGYVGSSGRSTAPHLHYEVTFHGKHLDPKTFLEAKQHVFQN
jgi:murein DD-endopeptidase MepM/ murein hydrolase activator NlpD